MLQQRLAKRLPPYMVPSFFFGIDEWPRTSSGKIDRKLLPAPNHKVVTAEIVAPRNETESIIRDMFAGVLGLDPENVGVTCDFFALGGNSLSAFRLVSKLQRADIGFDGLLPADVMARPTVALLPEMVGDKTFSWHTGNRLPLITSDGVEAGVEYPVSQNQAQLLTVHVFNEDSAAYNIPMGLELQGAVCINALRRVVRRLVLRHSALRTKFSRSEDGSFVQIVEGVADEVLRVEQVDRRSAAVSLIMQDAQQGFDLFGGDVMRGRLIRVDTYDVHLLVINVHHVAFDGMSTSILLQEISTLYVHYEGGIGDNHAVKDLEELPFQYVDFARWQASLQGHPMMKAQRAYWREQLREGSLPVLEFPTDKPRPAVQSFAGDAVPFVIPANLVDRLHVVSSDLGMSMFQVMLSIWALLLCRHSGQEEVVIGVPYHGRDAAGLDCLIGYFINMLSLRIEVPQDQGCISFLRLTNQAATSAMQNALLPFQDVVNDLLPRLQRDTSRNPVFQTIFAWGAERGWAGVSNGELGMIFGADVVVSPVEELETTTTKCDIISSCSLDAHGCVCGSIEFASHLYNLGSVKRLASRLITMTKSVLDDSDNNVWSLPMMPPNEFARVLFDFNDTAVAYPRDATLHDLFRSQVQRHPDAAAVEWQGIQLTYAQLHERSDILASRLVANGVTANNLVALQLDKSLEMAVAIIGVLKTGAAFVPMDPAWPLDRREFILQDVQCRHLVLHDRYRHEFSSADVCILSVDKQHTFSDASPSILERSNKVSQGNLAYVIYTSGSTGKPKGARVPHVALVNHIQIWYRFLQLDTADRFGLPSNYVFDAMYCFFFNCLCLAGGTGVFFDIAHDMSKLSDSGVVAIDFVPSAVSAVDLPKSLRVLVCGGETITEQASSFVTSGGRMFNSYGPTEAAIDVTSIEYKNFADFVNNPKSIGWSHPNVVSYVASPTTLDLQPIGVHGELLIGGIQIGEGYVNRKTLTSEKFIAHPWPQSDTSGHGTIYRTGDLVRYSEDGQIEFAGRIDFQVKLRGHRIELGEIENALRALEGVTEAVVLLRTDIGSEPALVAYLQPVCAVADLDTLKQSLADHIPHYMVPLIYLGVEDWPRSSSDKIDRKLLPLPDLTLVNAEIIAPRNETEVIIHSVFAEVLGLKPDDVGVNSNIFTMGGNSLTVFRLVHMLQRTDIGFDGLLPIDVISRPTVALLAEMVVDVESRSRLPLIAADGVQEGFEYPVSQNQAQLLTVHAFNESSAAYNIPMTLKLQGSISTNALRRAFRRLVLRHSVLRTQFGRRQNSTFIQIVQSVPDDALIVQDAGTNFSAVSLIMADVQRGFDLFGGNVMRSRLICVSNEDIYFLMINVHHVAFDGMSTSILLREVSSLYLHYISGLGDDDLVKGLEKLPFQYIDFARWQASLQGHPMMKAQRAYWREQLREGSLPVLEFPVDKPRPPVQTFTGDVVPFAIPANVVDRLRILSSDLGMSMFQVVLSLWTLLLCRHSGQEDVVVGVPYHGRDAAGLDSLIGYFINMLSLRIEVPQDQDCMSFFRSTKETTTLALQNTQLSFQEVVNNLLLYLHRDASRNAVFQTIFAWGAERGWAGVSGEDLGMVFGGDMVVSPVMELETTTTKCDVSLSCSIDANGCISGAIEFASHLYDRRSLGRVASRLVTLVESAVADSERNVWAMPMMPADEFSRVLFEFNDTSARFPRDVCLQDLFREQVERHPHAAAVEYQAEQLTYSDLDHRSDQLAMKLQSDGVTPGAIVVLQLQKSVEMTVAILGVLKAGGVFLPMDPDWPLERKQFILHDVSCRHVVTQSRYTIGFYWFQS